MAGSEEEERTSGYCYEPEYRSGVLLRCQCERVEHWIENVLEWWWRWFGCKLVGEQQKRTHRRRSCGRARKSAGISRQREMRTRTRFRPDRAVDEELMIIRKRTKATGTGRIIKKKTLFGQWFGIGHRFHASKNKKCPGRWAGKEDNGIHFWSNWTWTLFAHILAFFGTLQWNYDLSADCTRNRQKLRRRAVGEGSWGRVRIWQGNGCPSLSSWVSAKAEAKECRPKWNDGAGETMGHDHNDHRLTCSVLKNMFLFLASYDWFRMQIEWRNGVHRSDRFRHLYVRRLFYRFPA